MEIFTKTNNIMHLVILIILMVAVVVEIIYLSINCYKFKHAKSGYSKIDYKYNIGIAILMLTMTCFAMANV